jgi:hypothetical protein
MEISPMTHPLSDFSRRARIFLGIAGFAAGVLVLGGVAHGEPKAQNGATVSLWAADLAGPEGLARAESGEILVVENGSGRVLRFSASGERLGVLTEGLEAPSWALYRSGALYVSERKGHAVSRIGAGGQRQRLEGEVLDPLGLAIDPRDPAALLVVSHRQSLVRRFAPAAGKPVPALMPEAFAAPPTGARYGWRDLAITADGTLYLTDELSGTLLRRVPGGDLDVWLRSLSSPSGLLLTPSGALYLTEEGTGRVSRVTPEGERLVLAEGLGKARALHLLDERTLLVTDRAGGTIWKIGLP